MQQYVNLSDVVRAGKTNFFLRNPFITSNKICLEHDKILEKNVYCLFPRFLSSIYIRKKDHCFKISRDLFVFLFHAPV